MKQFAKLDAGLYMNPKIRKAGQAARDVFVFLLCRNSELDAEGCLPVINVDPQYLGDVLGVSGDAASSAVTRAVEVGLISVSVTHVTILGWSDEWGKRPMSGAERQAKYKTSKEVTRGDDANVSDDASDASEKKRREEKRVEETLSADPPVVAPKARRKRPAVSLPADWVPKGDAPDRELERFKLHAQANDRHCVDWDAAWRMWLSKSADYQRAGPKQSQTPFELQMQRVADLEAAERRGAQ